MGAPSAFERRSDRHGVPIRGRGTDKQTPSHHRSGTSRVPASAERDAPSGTDPRPARTIRSHGDRDPAGVRGGRRADGPRHRPGPRRDRPAGRRCTSRTSRAPRRAATGSPATWTARSPRAGSRRTSATPRSPGSSRPPTWPRAADADIVIEAVFEDLAVKPALWRDIDAVAPAAAIFASNTSSIAIHRLAEAVGRERRPQFVGMHFFSPVPVMPLIELIRGRDTDDATEAAIRDLGGAARQAGHRLGRPARASSSTAS